MRPIACVAVAILALGCGFNSRDPIKEHARNRQALFDAIRPVKLSNCTFERVGDKHDGGYVMCGNLTGRAQSLYSYGIAASDEWGCTLSARLQVPVHQYDCFELRRPPCAAASPVFHEECVGPNSASKEGRLFDNIASQLSKNGDSGKLLLMKMDVEGSEWESFMATPDAVFEKIDQLVVEFHGVEDSIFVDTMLRLKKHFHVVNVHYNNWTCHPDTTPHPATTYEVLFVNKQIGVVDATASAPFSSALDAPNNPLGPDCQVAPATELKSPR